MAGVSSLHNPPAVRAFREALEAVRPEVVNAHNVHLHLSYGCLSAADRMGIPVVFTAQDAMAIVCGKLQHYVDPSSCPPSSPEIYRLPRGHNLRQARFRFNPLRNLGIRHTLRHHARVRVAVSHALRQALEINGLSEFRVVPSGSAGDELEVPAREVEEVRRRLEVRGRRVILLAGRISEEKGSVQALAALAKVVSSGQTDSASACPPSLTAAISSTLVERPRIQRALSWIEASPSREVVGALATLGNPISSFLPRIAETRRPLHRVSRFARRRLFASPGLASSGPGARGPHELLLERIPQPDLPADLVHRLHVCER